VVLVFLVFLVFVVTVDGIEVVKVVMNDVVVVVDGSMVLVSEILMEVGSEEAAVVSTGSSTISVVIS